MQTLAKRFWAVLLISGVLFSALLIAGASNDELLVQQAGQSDSAGVRVIPQEAVAGSSYLIIVSGLQPREAVSVRITNDESGAQAYRSEQIASDTGVVQIDLFSTSDDVPGDYTVEVLNGNGAVIGSAELTILEPTGRNGTINVTPQTGLAGETFTLEIADINPFADLEIVVRDGVNTRVYDARVRATVEGTATIEWESGPFDGGEYVVTVTDLGQDVDVAQVTIPVEATAFANISIIPERANPGDQLLVSVTGLQPNLTAQISINFAGTLLGTVDVRADANGTLITPLPVTDEAIPGAYEVAVRQSGRQVAQAQYAVAGNAITVLVVPPTGTPTTNFLVSLNGFASSEVASITVLRGEEVIIEQAITADVNGTAIVPLTTEEPLPAGELAVQIVRQDVPVAIARFFVEAPAEANAVLNINPDELMIGDNFTVNAQNFAPQQEITLEIYFEGDLLFTVTRTADENGTLRLDLILEEGDPLGLYEVVAQRDGDVIAENTFQVTGPAVAEDIVLTVIPETFEQGENFILQAENAIPGMTYTIDVLLDGESVFSTERVAGQNGTFQLALTSEDDEPLGTYEIVVLEGETSVGTAGFEIVAAAQPPAAEDVQTADVTIQPTTGPLGTEYGIFISGLPANETAQIDIVYEGSVVFTTERTADRNGTASLVIFTEDTDPAGEYFVNVRVGTEVVGTASFTAEAIEEETIVEPTPEPQVIEREGTRIFSGELLQDVPTRRYEFQGTAGEQVIIATNSQTIDTYLILEDDAGRQIAENDDFANALNARIGPFELPYSGTYTAVVTSFDYFSGGFGETGDFTLRIESIQTDTITLNDSVDVTFGDAGLTRFLTFEGAAGTVIKVTANSNETIDTSLELLNPQGEAVATDDDGGVGLDPEISNYTLPADGTYTVVLRPFAPGVAGTVTVSVTQTDTRVLSENAQSLMLSSKTGPETLFFEGRAGELVSMNVRIVGGNVNNLSVVATQDNDELLSFRTEDLPENISFPLLFRVPQNGLVTITIEDPTSVGVDLEFSLERQ